MAGAPRNKKEQVAASANFLLHSRIVQLAHCIPIDYVPPCVDVVGAQVLVVEIIGVFPHIQTEDWGFACHHWVVLVGGAGDVEAAICLDDQPCPTAAKATDTGCLELGFELIQATPLGIDRILQLAIGCAVAGRAHDVPEEAMVVVSTTIVAHRGADILWHIVYVLADIFNALVFPFSAAMALLRLVT